MSRRLSTRTSRSSGADRAQESVLRESRRYRSGIIANPGPRRPSSLPLPNPIHRPSLEEVRKEGEIIYRTFIGEELEDDEVMQEAEVRAQARNNRQWLIGGGGSPWGVEELRQEVLLPARASTPEGYNASYFTRTGRAIRELANEFARSMEGRRVRERADDVPLSSITEERFINLLYEVFLEGFSRERLVALFTYCSRILVRALQAKVFDLAMNLFRWSLEYIRNQVARWVYQQGGWERVLWNFPWVKITITSLTVIGVSVLLGGYYFYIS